MEFTVESDLSRNRKETHASAEIRRNAGNYDGKREEANVSRGCNERRGSVNYEKRGRAEAAVTQGCKKLRVSSPALLIGEEEE